MQPGLDPAGALGDVGWYWCAHMPGTCTRQGGVSLLECPSKAATVALDLGRCAERCVKVVGCHAASSRSSGLYPVAATLGAPRIPAVARCAACVPCCGLTTGRRRCR